MVPRVEGSWPRRPSADRTARSRDVGDAAGADPVRVSPPPPTAAAVAHHRNDENRRTVFIALGANLLVATVKFVAGAVTGSQAVLAEGAHSVADGLNEVFLLIALRRGERPPDRVHPFGFGMERFFWAFLAALSIFVTGAAFALIEGVRSLLAGQHQVTGLALAYGALAVAVMADGMSAGRALRHLRRDANRSTRPLWRQFTQTTDPTAKTVLLEDGAGLVGVALAALGLLLHQVTGDGRWDALGSIAVGLLLAAVAFEIGRNARSMLLGQAASPQEIRLLWQVLARHPEIEHIVELRTMHLGPDELLVTARVELQERLTTAEVERLGDSVRADMLAVSPKATQVFLDGTTAMPNRESLDRLAPLVGGRHGG